jgi:cell division protein FtsQ
MARERIEFTGQEEPRTLAAAREDISARAIDLENDEETQFLRAEKRVPVRRGPLAKQTASRVKIALKLAVATALLGGLTAAAYAYGIHSGRFRIESSDSIEISGVRNASRVQVMEVAGADIGRNVFFVPLEERKKQLEQIPWVESATVMRLLPSHIAVSIAERTPVAFVQIGPKVSLIDANGVVMGPPASRQTKYSFPVIHGISETEALSSRAAVMKIYNRMVRELDSSDYTRQLSEVDLSDPEDVKATVNDSGGTVLVHLGASDFLERYKLFAGHIGEWRQQFKNVQSVDLRYEGQIIVNPDGGHALEPGPPTAVKPAEKPTAKPPQRKRRTHWRRKKPSVAG